MLARETNLEEAVKFAERLRKLIEDYNFLAGENITASFGVAEVKARDNKASLLKKVDQAMYKAKESGRNQVANLQVEYY